MTIRFAPIGPVDAKRSNKTWPKFTNDNQLARSVHARARPFHASSLYASLQDGTRRAGCVVTSKRDDVNLVFPFFREIRVKYRIIGQKYSKVRKKSNLSSDEEHSSNHVH